MQPEKLPARRIALKLAGFYALVAGLWVLFSDRLLERLIADPEALGRFQTWKGEGFVLVTAALLFALSYRYLKRLQRREATILKLGRYDPLTGLPNQQLFEQRLEYALSEAERAGEGMAVMYFDLDRFKTLLHTLGHEAADEVLMEVSRRWLEHLGKEATLAHFQGDEFALLAPGVTDRRQASELAERLVEALAAPFQVAGHSLHLSTSIGIVLFPEDGRSADSLMKHVAAAVSRAKVLQRPPYQFYSPEIRQQSVETLVLENRLRQALAGDEFVMVYQAQGDLPEGGVHSLEALVSWRDPERPGLSPADFIPLAEATGLIEPLGEWVLRTVCRQNRQWQEAGLPPVRVAVNLSVQQLERQGIAELVANILEETGLEPRWLELEITESVFAQNMAETVAVLKKLVDLGVRIAIDDFGTGYSSLSYLRYLPVTTLKLDNSFIASLPDNTDDAAIVAAVIAMAHTLDLEVVAEGVEKEEQRVFLQEKGCDKIQGYLFAPPLPAEEMARMLAGRRSESQAP